MLLVKGLIYIMLALMLGLAFVELYFVLLRLYYAIKERT